MLYVWVHYIIYHTYLWLLPIVLSCILYLRLAKISLSGLFYVTYNTIKSAQPAFFRVRWLFSKKGRNHYEWKDIFWTLPYPLVVRVTIARSSHRRCSVKKGVLKIFANFTRKHYAGVFLINLQTSGLQR